MRRIAHKLFTFALVFSPCPAFAQAPTTIGTPEESGLLASSYDGEFLRELPTSDNLFAVIETLQPSIIADRFSGGGLNAGQPARIGGFLSSWTQTVFRVDGVPITDPTGSGEPLLFPELVFWSRVDIRTGLFRADTNAVGLAIDLMPLAPSDRWVRRTEGSVSHSGLAGGVDASTTVPAIARLDGWDRATVVAAGPLVRSQLGAVLGVSMARSSQFSRSDPFPAGASLASAFSQAVLTATDRDTVRMLGWIQQRKYPLRERGILNQPQATAGNMGGHAQAVWERAGTLAWRGYASYSRRRRTPEFAAAASGVTERLVDGPVSEMAALSRNTVQTWSLGARISPTFVRRGRAHRLDVGIETTGDRIESSAFFAGTIGELVHESPARVWRFDRPGNDSSLRRGVTVGAFVSDRVMATRRLALDLGLRFESASGSARGAETDISWHTLLPRAAGRWNLAGPWRAAAFAGYSRSAHRLALDYLAIGDPAAPIADVFRWTALAGGALPLSARGPHVTRIGPGTGGDPAFSAIDPDLARPTTDEIVIGVETRPRDNLLLSLTGIVRTARNLPAVVNVGAPASAYASFSVDEPGDLNPSDDNRVLSVFNRLPASFGQDRYLLTTPARENASFKGLEIGVRITTSALTLVGGATAGIAESSAGSRGFGPLENDPSVLGELFVNPNATELANGRPFLDRAYTVKFAGVYQFPADVRLGVIARYQHGQPFSRLIVFPGLNQGAEAVRTSPNGGQRFPFIHTVDARIQKTFTWSGRRVDAFGDVFNVLGLSRAVEQDVTAISTHSATAIQPPRTIHVGLRVTF